jgi:hypothetical protein
MYQEMDRKNINAIESLLRKGFKQLEAYSAEGVKNIQNPGKP